MLSPTLAAYTFYRTSVAERSFPLLNLLELNFRDAKQYWGLEDVMNVTPTGVTNAANLSLFIVNVAYGLRADSHARDAASPTASWT